MKTMEIPINVLSAKDDDNNELTEYRSYIIGEITHELTEKVIETLYLANELNTVKKTNYPIRLIINSVGGDLHCSQMICDVMEEIETPVYTYGYGQVCSGGIIIFMKGEKGYRFSSKLTQFMTHRFSTSINGTHSDLKIHNSEMDRMFERLINHYEECTQLPRDIIEKDLLSDHDVWLNAEECYDYNIVDQIIGVNLNGRPKKYVTTKRRQKRIRTTKSK